MLWVTYIQGMMNQRHSQGHLLPWKGVLGESEVAKLNVESGYQVRGRMAQSQDFSAPNGGTCMTTCISKRHSSSFHIR